MEIQSREAIEGHLASAIGYFDHAKDKDTEREYLFSWMAEGILWLLRNTPERIGPDPCLTKGPREKPPDVEEALKCLARARCYIDDGLELAIPHLTEMRANCVRDCIRRATWALGGEWYERGTGGMKRV